MVNLSKAESIEKEYRKRIKNHRRIIKYKEKFGIKPKSIASMEDDIEKEKILRAKSRNQKKVKTKLKKIDKLSKKRKKSLKLKVSFYESKEWRRLRYTVLKKYERTCLCCGRKAPDVPIHVDHIKPRSIYPELELDPDNLQLLCEDCNLGKSNTDCIDYRSH